MELSLREAQGQRFVEGPHGQPLMERVDDVAMVIEACYGEDIDRVLLYAENLPEHFFDLSSGEAGAILQKLRTYHIRLAVVDPGATPRSSMFREMAGEEHYGDDFRLFDERAAAQAWLLQASQ